MKQKSQASDLFVKFKAMMENEAGLKIKTLRSENGAEYLSHQFREILQKSGVQHQLTAPYSPQQNGVSERKSRVIPNMARCQILRRKCQISLG